MRQADSPHIFSNPMYLVPLYEIRLVSRNVLDGRVEKESDGTR